MDMFTLLQIPPPAMFIKSINQTSMTYFIIKGISDRPELQVPVFLLTLVIYLITIGGNITILLLVCLDHQLHIPMYFFLGNLSIVDMSSVTVTLHKILISFITGNKSVSFLSCMTQLYFFASFTGHELLILTVMSYDRYVAICNPLRYHTIMSNKVCVLLITVCWIWGFLQVIPPVFLLAGFSCYVSNEINHFFCDMVPLMNLSCNDTSVLAILNLTEGLILSTLTPFVLTIISYVFIIITILRIQTSTGRRKAFYTCSSHLTVVIILYVLLICQYLIPTRTNNLDFNKLFSLFNTAIVPMLNPLIYSLKNKDVNSALKSRLQRWELTT
ncbi:olfactory receptor 6C74-like [Rhinophrynus dorsalis]